jgi:dihydroneopterin aldolase
MIVAVGLSADQARNVAERVPLDIDRLAQRELVSDVVEALFEGSSGARIEKLAGRIAAAAWPDVLRPAFERGLDVCERELREQLELFERARAELARPARTSKLPAAVVEQLAYDLAEEMDEAMGELSSIEIELEDEELTADERLQLILRLPAKVAGAAEIPWEEADRLADRVRDLTVASVEEGEDPSRAIDALRDDICALATDQRRASIRDALRQLAANVHESLPLVSTAAVELAARPAPADPADDELWVAAMNGLAAQMLVDRIRP